MAKIKFRIRFNEGRVGVPLEKLERIATETRKFLDSIASDLNLPRDIKWLGSKFANRSLSYDIEGNCPVEESQSDSFKNAIAMMSQGDIPPFITRESAGRFYGIAKSLETDERIKFGVYNGTRRAHWYAMDASIHPKVAPIQGTIQYVGAIQGTLHSWFKEASPAYFYLRDTVSHDLIQCKYTSDSVYDQLVQAFKNKNNVLHIHGDITADRARKAIKDVHVDKLMYVKPFTMRDLDEYLDSENVQ